MDIKDGIEPVTTLKSKSAELIRRAKESQQPIVITQNGKATAVLQDVESLERQRKALLLLKIVSQGDEDYREGKTISHAQAKSHFHRKLNPPEDNG